MNCRVIGNAIVCGSFKKKPPPCAWCVRSGVNRCDAHRPDGFRCDVYICDNHAQDRGNDFHLCPDHAV